MSPYVLLHKGLSRTLSKAISIVVLVAFVLTSVPVPVHAQASDAALSWLPKPGVMVDLSPGFKPAHLKGMVIHPDNALQFDFLVHHGDEALVGAQKQEEYKKLIKYFLASLAIPDDDQWVNLSPYEKNRIIQDDFGKTEMGRDLLAQDYLLKQITASLIYPESKLGQAFWDKVYAQAQSQFGTTEIPVNTFNKVWIMPDEAYIYEQGNTVYIVKQRLKVMLEEDYLSLEKHNGINQPTTDHLSLTSNQTNKLGSQIVREIVLPALEKEINEGKNFANLRQVYSGMLLAAWYKRALKESLLGKIYANQAKVKGVDQADPKANQAIYQQYIKAFKKGVFNYIKEDVDKYTKESIPRKYFSGGATPYTNEVFAAKVHNADRKMAAAAVAGQDSMMEAIVTKLETAGDATHNELGQFTDASGQLVHQLEATPVFTMEEINALLGQNVSVFYDPPIGTRTSVTGQLVLAEQENGYVILKIRNGNSTSVLVFQLSDGAYNPNIFVNGKNPYIDRAMTTAIPHVLKHEKSFQTKAVNGEDVNIFYGDKDLRLGGWKGKVLYKFRAGYAPFTREVIIYKHYLILMDAQQFLIINLTGKTTHEVMPMNKFLSLYGQLEEIKADLEAKGFVVPKDGLNLHAVTHLSVSPAHGSFTVTSMNGVKREFSLNPLDKAMNATAAGRADAVAPQTMMTVEQVAKAIERMKGLRAPVTMSISYIPGNEFQKKGAKGQLQRTPMILVTKMELTGSALEIKTMEGEFEFTVSNDFLSTEGQGYVWRIEFAVDFKNITIGKADTIRTLLDRYRPQGMTEQKIIDANPDKPELAGVGVNYYLHEKWATLRIPLLDEVVPASVGEVAKKTSAFVDNIRIFTRTVQPVDTLQSLIEQYLMPASGTRYETALTEIRSSFPTLEGLLSELSAVAVEPISQLMPQIRSQMPILAKVMETGSHSFTQTVQRYATLKTMIEENKDKDLETLDLNKQLTELWPQSIIRVPLLQETRDERRTVALDSTSQLSGGRGHSAADPNLGRRRTASFQDHTGSAVAGSRIDSTEARARISETNVPSAPFGVSKTGLNIKKGIKSPPVPARSTVGSEDVALRKSNLNATNGALLRALIFMGRGDQEMAADGSVKYPVPDETKLGKFLTKGIVGVHLVFLTYLAFYKPAAIDVHARPLPGIEQKTNAPAAANPGGIDLNAANLNLQIKRDGKGVPLPLAQQDLEHIRIDGLIPVIIDIRPAATLPVFADLKNSSKIS